LDLTFYVKTASVSPEVICLLDPISSLLAVFGDLS